MNSKSNEVLGRMKMKPLIAALKKTLRVSKAWETDDWHTSFLVNCARLIRPNLYVEIGIYEAATLNEVAKYCNHAIGIDTNPKSLTHIRGKNISGINNTSDALPSHRLIEDNHLIELAFIDGNHDSDQVLRDFRNIRPFCSRNCLVIFHDTFPRSPDFLDRGLCSDSYRVPELIYHEFASEWSYVTIPRHPGMTIFSQRNQLACWMR
jgi:hypothetical protein